VEFGATAIVDMNDLHRRWFDRWLKDEHESERSGFDQAAVRVFLSGRNSWTDLDAWAPTASTAQRWYLGERIEGGPLSLQTTPPAADGRDTYVYDPDDPVVTVFDFDFYGAIADPTRRPIETPLDQSLIESRPDVLVYTSTPLDEDIAVVGPVGFNLFASSDCPDTDWVVTLTDVDEQGRSIKLASGVLRARYRESLEREELLVPDTVYEFRLDLGSVGHVFSRGHGIRVTITSSEFPHYDRNPNTGHPIGADDLVQVATNTVHRSPLHPSSIELPVLSEP
jgi:uncharacterized protein